MRKTALSRVLRWMRPREEMEVNLFQWVLLAAHSRFSLMFRNYSSWVKLCSSDSPIMADP